MSGKALLRVACVVCVVCECPLHQLSLPPITPCFLRPAPTHYLLFTHPIYYLLLISQNLLLPTPYPMSLLTSPFVLLASHILLATGVQRRVGDDGGGIPRKLCCLPRAIHGTGRLLLTTDCLLLTTYYLLLAASLFLSHLLPPSSYPWLRPRWTNRIQSFPQSIPSDAIRLHPRLHATPPLSTPATPS